MPVVQIPFPLSTAPGAFNQEESGRLVNAYAEPLGATLPGKASPTPKVVWRKSPGLSLFGNSTFAGFRGGIVVGGTLLYTAWNEKVTTFLSNGTETVLTGSLSGEEKVFWARNNASPPDLVCVAPFSGAFTVSSTAVLPYGTPVDPDIGSPNSVGFMDGYFIFTYGDGTIQASGLNSTSINPPPTGDYTKEQSKTGGLLRGLPFNGQYYVFGPNHSAVYSNTANPVGFPFSRSYVIQRGIYGRYAVAGHEDGFGSALIWVADDASVVMGNGSPNPTKISPPDLDRLIEDVTNRDSLEASVYISQGHPKWVLTCPTFTWEFDLGTQKWNERESYLATRWRAILGVHAFDKWIVGDFNTKNLPAGKLGRLLFVDDDAFNEYLEPLIMRLESGPVTKFPNRTRVARADFNFVVGTGDALGPDPSATVPTVGIQWSNDGGFTWSNELIRRIGRQSNPGNSNLVMLRTGQTRNIGRRWRFRVSGEVYAAFLGATQDTVVSRF